MHIVLFMTKGMSLTRWKEAGLLERETALYRRLAADIGPVTMVTYGGKNDVRLAADFDGLDVFCNQAGWPGRIHRWRVGRYRPRGSGPVVYKSNQLSGAELGLTAARRAKVPFYRPVRLPVFAEHRTGLRQGFTPGPAGPAAGKECFSRSRPGGADHRGHGRRGDQAARFE